MVFISDYPGTFIYGCVYFILTREVRLILSDIASKLLFFDAVGMCTHSWCEAKLLTVGIRQWKKQCVE